MEITTKFPKSVNAYYTAEMRKMLNKYRLEVNQQILPLLKQHEIVYAMADSADGLLATIYRLIDDIGKLIGSEIMQKIAKAWLSKMMSWQVKNGALGQINTINMSRLLQTFRIEDALNNALTENVKLIKSVPERYLQDVKNVIAENFKNGNSYTSAKHAINEIYQQQGYKIERIARTETAKLNTDVTRLQAKSIGCTHFIWMTAGDERMCNICAPLNGQELPLDGTLLPGHVHVNDRCVMKLVFNN